MTSSDTTPDVRSVLRLRRDARLIENPGGDTLIEYPNGFVRLGVLPEGAHTALHALTGAPVTDAELGERVGEANLLRAQLLIKKLDTGGLLEHGLHRDGEPLATLRPLGRGSRPGQKPPHPDTPCKLSRFVTIRAEAGRLLAQSPDSHLALELHEPLVPLIGALADWTTGTNTCMRLSGLDERTVNAALGMVVGAGLLLTGDPEYDPETDTMAGWQWSVPDLWQHSRSRGQLLSQGYGGTYPLVRDYPALPLVPETRGSERIALPAPDLTAAAAAATDLPLTKVLERRRSIREHDADAPITVEALGELLYRCARTRNRLEVEGDELGSRPYPAGGALHELEIYPVITTCAGVPSGLWHYDTGEHWLERVPGDEAASAALVETARVSSLMTDPPQVLLVVTARFGRVMRKYEGMAYALILKHVGVLYQTFYLVATSMGLAPCALGGGDADTFARASGLDRRSEGSVGEFIVGSARDGGEACSSG